MFEATRRVGMQVLPLVVRCVGRASVLPRAGRSAIRRSSDAATEAGEEEVFNELDVLYRLKRLEGETAQLGKLRDKLNGYGEEFARSRELRADVRTMEVGWRQDLAGTNTRIDKLGSELRAEMKQLGSELRAEMKELGSELRAEIGKVDGKMDKLGSELRAEMKALGGELRAEISKVGEASRRDFRLLFSVGASAVIAYIAYNEEARKREAAEASEFRTLVRGHLGLLAPPKGVVAPAPSQDAQVSTTAK